MDEKTFEYIYHEANNGEDSMPTDNEVDLMRHLLNKWEESNDMFGAVVAAYFIGKYVQKIGF